jgi:hypothetical protein
MKIRSIEEFKKKYFPRSFEKERISKITDPKDLGIEMAKKTIEKIWRMI